MSDDNCGPGAVDGWDTVCCTNVIYYRPLRFIINNEYDDHTSLIVKGTFNLR